MSQQQQRHHHHLLHSTTNGPFGDTTYTKVFVGGLAWETQRDTMRLYFEQFGEILEAVVISDKNTGRSKGYGFVTFKEPEAARRACEEPNPVIDGRRANCNLAAFGATANHRSRPTTRPLSPQLAHGGLAASAYSSSSAPAAIGFYQQPHHYAFPYYSYGYSGGYSHEGMYPMSYYRVATGVGGAGGGAAGGAAGGQHQFVPYYTCPTSTGFMSNYYPYYPQYLHQSGHGAGELQYQYLHHPHQYSPGILSLPPQHNMNVGLTQTGGLAPIGTATAGPTSSMIQAPPLPTMDCNPAA